jgi:hypothetical protein
MGKRPYRTSTGLLGRTVRPATYECNAVRSVSKPHGGDMRQRHSIRCDCNADLHILRAAGLWNVLGCPWCDRLFVYVRTTRRCYRRAEIVPGAKAFGAVVDQEYERRF